MPAHALPALAAQRPLPRLLQRLTPARARFWLVLAIHLGAFAVLYLGTFSLLERAASEAGATAARYQLDAAVAELPFLWMGTNRSAVSHVVANYQGIGLNLYSKDGTLANAARISPDPEELAQVRGFLARGGASESRVVAAGGREWVRGVVRITAGEHCVPCHQQGQTMGAAAMKVDFTAPLQEIREGLRGRMAALLGVWVALVGGVAVVAQRAAVRAGVRLRAELHAVEKGQPHQEGDGERPALPLDPVTAEVHRNLRQLLQRQRERESHVASRLERADQLASLGQLAAGLAHEIKNPLAGIQGALELLRDETADAPTAKLYGEMLGELARVDGILRRLLESGRPAPLRLARADLNRLLAEVAELLRPSLRRRRVELRAECAPGLAEVPVDATKLRQVLLNLIQNAVEAMPETGGTVAVRASALDGERTAVIAVEDDGPGIPTDALGRLFEPFYTTKLAGTGLGLAISKGLVEQHGGRIEVTSEPGRGTTFFIFLPLDTEVGTS